MLTSLNNNKIRIHITTYKKENEYSSMNTHKRRVAQNHKYICDLCLNSNDNNPESNRNASSGCPICQKDCKACKQTLSDRTTDTVPKLHVNAKFVQTCESDVSQNLLNEVLTVFRNKKETHKEKSKTCVSRDASVATDNSYKTYKSQLTINTFQYSIDDTIKPKNGTFLIVNKCQPIFIKSHHAIDLSKQKSSSVPQMKVEELKNSLKKRTTSRDAIEEVNRMFATVRKHDSCVPDTNRPLVRNGPRVLPVVKTNATKENKKDLSNIECTAKVSTCKCCQTNACMSSGDSLSRSDLKPDGNQMAHQDKCVYMLCCHHKNQCRTHTGAMICDQCKNINDHYYCFHDNFTPDDSY